VAAAVVGWSALTVVAGAGEEGKVAAQSMRNEARRSIRKNHEKRGVVCMIACNHKPRSLKLQTETVCF
jgi:hypothetical protein